MLNDVVAAVGECAFSPLHAIARTSIMSSLLERLR
jgi:hypothetical protein